MISGLSHITFTVSSIERAAEFFTAVFDAKEIYSSDGRNFSLAREKFLLISGLWICIMEGEPQINAGYNHIAFHVPERELDIYISKLQKIGAKIKDGRPRLSGEGRSVYFYDFDNHLFELHTGTLTERLARYSEDTD